MVTKRHSYQTVDEYISSFPADVQAILQKIRKIIRKAAPKAEESISYQIPTFKLGGRVLIYFAAFSKHASLYPASRGSDEFANELSAYKGGKGTVQFPFGEPVPFELIERIVKFKKRAIDEKAPKKR